MWYRILHRSLKWVIESNGPWNYSYILCVYMCTNNKPLYEERSGERDRWYRPVFNLQPTSHNLPLKIIWSWLLWVTRAPTEQIQGLAWYSDPPKSAAKCDGKMDKSSANLAYRHLNIEGVSFPLIHHFSIMGIVLVSAAWDKLQATRWATPFLSDQQ